MKLWAVLLVTSLQPLHFSTCISDLLNPGLFDQKYKVKHFRDTFLLVKCFFCHRGDIFQVHTRKDDILRFGV